MKRATLEIDTAGQLDIVDLTGSIERVVKEAEIDDCVVHVFAVGSTVAITTTEFEQGVLADLRTMLEMVVPSGADWCHDAHIAEGNAHSHLRAALIGPDVVVPVIDGRLGLGTWQQVVLIELDRRSRRRNVIVTLIGEER